MIVNRKLLIIYGFCLHLCIVFLIAKTNFIEKLKLKLGYPLPEISEFYLEMVEYHKRIDASLPNNAVLFFGDSHIQGLHHGLEGVTTANFGIGNDTTMGVRRRLIHHNSLKTAQAVVLQIGINDLEYRSSAETQASYEKLLNLVPVSTSILLNAVFPVAEDMIADNRQWNKEISELNTGLQAACRLLNRCHYIDIGDSLLDKDGDLSEKFHIGDGVHLNAAANEIWKSAIEYELKLAQ